MAENSKIEWTDHTVNLWWGCAKVHTGCKNCYAEHLSDNRYKKNLWGEKQPRQRIKSWRSDLDKYQRQAQKDNKIVKVFIGSMMDIFEESKPLLNPSPYWNETKDIRNTLFNDIKQGHYQNLVFLFLTKRPENINLMIPTMWCTLPPKNVWFGTSVSNQETTESANKLSNLTPVNANRFLSIEPQVGDIEILFLEKIDWVIQGGESGNNKRPFDLRWAYQLKAQCSKSKIPYFFKQIDKIQEIPEDLQIREFPNFQIGNACL